VDQVFIKGLQLEAVIGVYDWERSIRQPLVLDLDMAWDISTAAATDDLAATLDYAVVTQRVQALVEGSCFQLLESLAEAIATLLRDEFAVQWVRLTLTKPTAVPAAAGGVGVMIERGQGVS
jgi:dihydroneopterin aldolase